MIEEKELIKGYKGGNGKALDEIFNRNEKLIHSVYEKYFRNSGCPKEDLFQEGCVGLMDAIRLFKEEKSEGFNRYKVLWIKKRMFDFRKNFFKTPTTPLGIEHLNIEAPVSGAEKIRYALFELDNLVESGSMTKASAQKIVRKIIKGTR